MIARVGLMLPLLVAAVLLAGCGQGEYDARMDGVTGVLRSRGASAGAELVAPNFTTIQGLKLRLPTLFSQQAQRLDNIPRAKFSAADVPGFLYTLERQLADESGNQIPAYCYVYAVNKATTPPDTLHAALQAAASGLDGSANWAPGTAAGGIAVQRLEAQGTMDYELAGAVTESQPSRLVLYSLDAGENQVVIGFRAADVVATSNKVFAGADAAIATAQLDNPAAAPAPAPMPNP